MVELYINRCAFKLIFFLSQIAFICIPGLSQDNKFSLTNIPSDSSNILIKNPVLNASQKQRLFKFYTGLEFGYSRLKRNYHIDVNPVQSVQLLTPMINGDEVYIGFTGEVIFKSRFCFNTGILGQYQRFHYKITVASINGYRKYMENSVYGMVPLSFSIAIPFKHSKIYPELGYLHSFLFYSEYFHIDSSPYGRTVFHSENTIKNKYYSSIFLGVKFNLKNRKIFIHLKYNIGLTKIMLFHVNPTFPTYPVPDDYYLKNGVSLSIQYLFK
jgi:hypothetical protein